MFSSNVWDKLQFFIEIKLKLFAMVYLTKFDLHIIIEIALINKF